MFGTYTVSYNLFANVREVFADVEAYVRSWRIQAFNRCKKSRTLTSI